MIVKPSADALAQTLATTRSGGPKKSLPPVHLWNPPFCGNIDMRIARDGTWFHDGTPIARPTMVQMFSSVLKREGDDYFLVTPVEKMGIMVDDAPFVAVDVDVDPGADGADHGQRLTFTTHVGDKVIAGSDNPIRVVLDAATGAPSPYVHVRAGLEALIDRKTFYRLVDLAEVRDGVPGVWSDGTFFAIGASLQID